MARAGGGRVLLWTLKFLPNQHFLRASNDLEQGNKDA